MFARVHATITSVCSLALGSHTPHTQIPAVYDSFLFQYYTARTARTLWFMANLYNYQRPAAQVTRARRYLAVDLVFPIGYRRQLLIYFQALSLSCRLCLRRAFIRSSGGGRAKFQITRARLAAREREREREERELLLQRMCASACKRARHSR